MKHKIYLASKLHHADIAKSFVKDNTYDVTWTNRWQWFEGEVKDEKEFAAHFWENDFDDVDAADAVIVYGEPGDVLKGAILEAGYAIAKNKVVVCVGGSKSFGTWRYSQRVLTAVNLDAAVRAVNIALTYPP